MIRIGDWRLMIGIGDWRLAIGDWELADCRLRIALLMAIAERGLVRL